MKKFIGQFSPYQGFSIDGLADSHPVILYLVSFSLIKNLQTVTLYFLGFESLLSIIVIIFLPAYYCPVRDSQVPLIVPAYEL